MIPLDTYRNKIVGVFGLGRAGKATVEALLAGGATVFAWDDTAVSREALKEYHQPNFTLCQPIKWPWEDLCLVALSPGIPLTHPKPHEVVVLAKQHHRPVIGDIELLYQACPNATYVTITGTNGKSTTTALIGHILQHAGKNIQVGGNIGTAALSLEPLSEGDIYVLELSSYQLDLVATAHFDVAALLNITPDHLDRHGSMEGYIASKCHIFNHQTKHDSAIIAVDDAHTKRIAEQLQSSSAAKQIHVSAYGNHAPIRYDQGVLGDDVQNFSVDLSAVKSLQGQHNGQNAAIAYAACRAVGIEPELIAEAMLSFPGLAHRMEWVAEKNGVTFINDSKATNADATMHALKSFDAIYWILGGVPKAGGIGPLTSLFPRVKHAYLIGDAEDQFADTLNNLVLYTKSGTMQAAIDQAYIDAVESGNKAVILLSPASASFDQYPNFEARGEHFKQLVRGLL